MPFINIISSVYSNYLKSLVSANFSSISSNITKLFLESKEFILKMLFPIETLSPSAEINRFLVTPFLYLTLLFFISIIVIILSYYIINDGVKVRKYAPRFTLLPLAIFIIEYFVFGSLPLHSDMFFYSLEKYRVSLYSILLHQSFFLLFIVHFVYRSLTSSKIKIAKSFMFSFVCLITLECLSRALPTLQLFRYLHFFMILISLMLIVIILSFTCLSDAKNSKFDKISKNFSTFQTPKFENIRKTLAIKRKNNKTPSIQRPIKNTSPLLSAFNSLK